MLPISSDYLRTNSILKRNKDTLQRRRNTWNCCSCVGLRSRRKIVLPPLQLDKAQTDINSKTVDADALAVRLRDDESKFNCRQKYQSMFKNAPLYQVYDDRSTTTTNSPIAQVKKGQRNTNSLEFADESFPLIDADDSGQHVSDRSPQKSPNQKAINALDSDGRATPDGSRSPREKSPHPLMFDYRYRNISPKAPKLNENEAKSLKKPVKRTTSDPQEMKACVAQFAGTGINRAMWVSMPQVVSLGLANGLPEYKRKQQEALFEIITSEASYYRSLNVLIEVFYKSPVLQPGISGAVINHIQKHHLFSNILEIHLTSENLLRSMEACFRQDPWLVGLCDIVYDHVENNFDTYITYMKNQMFQYRTIEQLLKNTAFNTIVRNLQNHPDCAFLDLPSFLILPTQRIPRMCLLVSTVLKYAPKRSMVYQSGLVALAALDKCVREGEAQKLYLEQKERLMILAKLFEYKFDAKSLATASRRLVKEGQLGLLSVQHVVSSAFRKKITGIIRQKSIRASLFLFNDLLVIAKKRSNSRLSVDEYCDLTDVKVEIMDTPPGSLIFRHYPQQHDVHGNESKASAGTSALASKVASPPNSKEVGFYTPYAFRLIIQSETHPRAEYILQAKSLSDRERWIDAISPEKYTATDDRLARECPQVLIVRSYLPTEGDELELREGDSVGLLTSLSDGWCKGMLPGGKKGWFPDNVCVEIEDDSEKFENTKKFLLMEEARNVYNRKKARDQFVNFKKVEVTSKYR